MKRIPFEIDVPNNIKLISKIFNDAGFNFLLVGGCVRDSVLATNIKDWDLVTNAVPDEVERLLNATYNGIKFNTIPTGKQFGVINVFTSDNNEFEIATFRGDNYTNTENFDFRRPDSVTFGSIELDNKRRDLTINALYYDLSTNEIIDFNNGMYDIKNKIIRTVGKPMDRFNEDRLRILRAVRMACRFRFVFDESLKEVLMGQLTIDKVSNERIRDEFLKTLKTAKNKRIAINILHKTGLLSQIFKGLDIIINNNKEITYIGDMALIAYILRNNDLNKLNKILNLLSYSKDEVANISFLISLQNFTKEDILPFKKKLLNIKLKGLEIREFGLICKLNDKLLKNLINFNLTINGDEVMKEFGLKGPELGAKINELEVINFKKMFIHGK